VAADRWHRDAPLMTMQRRTAADKTSNSYALRNSFVAVLALLGLAMSAQEQSSVTVMWSASPGSAIAGYNVYYGTQATPVTVSSPHRIRALGNRLARYSLEPTALSSLLTQPVAPIASACIACKPNDYLLSLGTLTLN